MNQKVVYYTSMIKVFSWLLLRSVIVPGFPVFTESGPYIYIYESKGGLLYFND